MLSGKDLKILRKRAGLTQTDLARVIEVSVTSIIDTEKDKYKNSFTKQKIIDYLNNCNLIDENLIKEDLSVDKILLTKDEILKERMLRGISREELSKIVICSILTMNLLETENDSSPIVRTKINNYFKANPVKEVPIETIEFKTLEELKRWILKSPYKIDSWEDWTYLYKGNSSIEGEAMFNDLKVKIRKR
jgi:DNA-binding XRE family transcriptional regulator